jgi:hypothetical protein
MKTVIKFSKVTLEVRGKLYEAHAINHALKRGFDWSMGKLSVRYVMCDYYAVKAAQCLYVLYRPDGKWLGIAEYVPEHDYFCGHVFKRPWEEKDPIAEWWRIKKSRSITASNKNGGRYASEFINSSRKQPLTTLELILGASIAADMKRRYIYY